MTYPEIYLIRSINLLSTKSIMNVKSLFEDLAELTKHKMLLKVKNITQYRLVEKIYYVTLPLKHTRINRLYGMQKFDLKIMRKYFIGTKYVKNENQKNTI